MHHSERGDGPSPAHDRFSIKVVRIGDGQSLKFRMLGDRYSGLMTFYNGKSQYCPNPKQWLERNQNKQLFWKGYVAAEFWNADTRRWYACVLELTQASELDLRGRYKRGQTWLFYRQEKPKKGPEQPVMARLLESADPATLPPAFDVLPILRTLYNYTDLVLGTSNPVPGRILAVPSDGPAPPEEEGSKPPSAEEMEKIRKVIESTRDRFRMNGGTHGA
jgi:hypothetical protein